MYRWCVLLAVDVSLTQHLILISVLSLASCKMEAVLAIRLVILNEKMSLVIHWTHATTPHAQILQVNRMT